MADGECCVCVILEYFHGQNSPMYNVISVHFKFAITLFAIVKKPS